MESSVLIYAELLSQPCRSVVAFCEYSNIPYELKVINLLAGEHETEEFIKMNPFKEIPTMAHGDFYLNESAAIVMYLADAFNVDNEWYPKDIKLRARVNAYLHGHHKFTREPCRDYFFYCLVAPKYFAYPEPSESEKVRLKDNYEKYFSSLDWALEETGYIARTPHMTIADVFAYSEITQTEVFNIDWEAHPRAKKWFETVGLNPVVQQVHAPIRAAIARGI